MRSDVALLTLQGGAAAFALIAAVAWPRAGEAALLMPVGGQELPSVLNFAASHDVRLIAIDSAKGRVIARIDDRHSIFASLAAGIVPIGVSTKGCSSENYRGRL
ncbi:MAG: hypothetical protein GW858_08005 [Sphingomonadales bacterium]|nr:hypothetical protein [Sphingomonadales bacterium]NCQ20451.1 hypothetical protein [Sphingomonadales bacterium]NCT03059.1 hypothetical protein [Sphingomonadales bacterium]